MYPSKTHAGRTYVGNKAHVGAALQQQPHNVRVAVAGCPHQRHAPVLPHNTRGVQYVRTCTSDTSRHVASEERNGANHELSMNIYYLVRSFSFTRAQVPRRPHLRCQQGSRRRRAPAAAAQCPCGRRGLPSSAPSGCSVTQHAGRAVCTYMLAPRNTDHSDTQAALTPSTWSTSAPCSSSSSTASVWPLLAAFISAVHPFCRTTRGVCSMYVRVRQTQAGKLQVKKNE